MKVVVEGLGAAGLTAVALLSMTLFGDAVIRVSSLLWSEAHRLVLMHVLRDVASAEPARASLRSLTWARASYANVQQASGDTPD